TASTALSPLSLHDALPIYQHGVVGTQCQGGTQLLLGSGRAYGDRDDFSGDTLFLQAYGLFHGDFAEGVHGHLDVGEIDTAVVRRSEEHTSELQSREKLVCR